MSLQMTAYTVSSHVPHNMGYKPYKPTAHEHAHLIISPTTPGDELWSCKCLANSHVVNKD